MKLKPDNFTKALARKAITLKALSELSGVPLSTIINGKSKRGNNRMLPRNIGKLAAALDVDVMEIASVWKNATIRSGDVLGVDLSIQINLLYLIFEWM